MLDVAAYKMNGSAVETTHNRSSGLRPYESASAPMRGLVRNTRKPFKLSVIDTVMNAP
jgi:hypothetical protein